MQSVPSASLHQVCWLTCELFLMSAYAQQSRVAAIALYVVSTAAGTVYTFLEILSHSFEPAETPELAESKKRGNKAHCVRMQAKPSTACPGMLQCMRENASRPLRLEAT